MPKDLKDIPFEEVINPKRSILGDNMSVVPWRLLRIIALPEALKEKDADSIIYEIGKKIGRRLTVFTIEEFFNAFWDFRFGIVEIKEKTNKKIIIDIKECVTCSGIAQTGRPMCYFEGGLIAGALEKVLSKKVKVEETKCMGGFKDEVCRFEATISQ